jgi:hypothetical protein
MMISECMSIVLAAGWCDSFMAFWGGGRLVQFMEWVCSPAVAIRNARLLPDDGFLG